MRRPGKTSVPPPGSSTGSGVDDALPPVASEPPWLAKEYEPFSEEPVIPAFEIIATVASSETGPDGDYSNELDPQTLRPWIRGLDRADLHHVLPSGLQPPLGIQGQAHMGLAQQVLVALLRDHRDRRLLRDRARRRLLQRARSADAAPVDRRRRRGRRLPRTPWPAPARG
jgi:hypothetical protein